MCVFNYNSYSMLSVTYYHTMLCRPIARSMLSQDVRLSVTCRYCVETTKHILKIFFTIG